jgi:hypothetical protein
LEKRDRHHYSWNSGIVEKWNNGKVTRYETRDIDCRGWDGVKKKKRQIGSVL